MMESLSNYYALVAKIDEMTSRITSRYAGHITCKKGCDDCCRHLAIFPVEGVALASALSRLPKEEVARLLKKAGSAAVDGPCPLLENSECALYPYRPIICRTHGLPVVMSNEGKRRIDFCPMNFKDLETLPGDAVIDLEILNTMLAVVNRLFITEHFPPVNNRLSIAEALLLLR